MPTTYVGVSNFNPSITIPVDGDLADANSVNVSAKDELDTQINLFESYGQLMQSTSPLRVRFSSLNSIDVDPIPFIALTEGGTWKTTFTTTTTNVSDADLEGGGVFANNTWYYVYAYSVLGVCNFQISTVLPDIFFLYKSGTFSHKYICSFKTSNTGSVIPFEKYGNYITYEAGLAVDGGSATTITTVNTSLYIPPSNNVPRLCKIQLNIDSNIVFGDSEIFVFPRIGTDGYQFYARANGIDTTIFDISTDETRNIYYFVQNVPPTPVATFKILGYYE